MGTEETRWRVCWQNQGKQGLVITAAFFRKSPEPTAPPAAATPSVPTPATAAPPAAVEPAPQPAPVSPTPTGRGR